MSETSALPSNPNENEGTSILIGTVFITVLATITVFARFYVRLFIIRNTGWDVSLPIFLPLTHLSLP